MPVDYSQDKKIWSNEKENFIEVNDFDISKPTQFPKGTELTVYDDTAQKAVKFCFASPTGKWIEY